MFISAIGVAALPDNVGNGAGRCFPKEKRIAANRSQSQFGWRGTWLSFAVDLKYKFSGIFKRMLTASLKAFKED